MSRWMALCLVLTAGCTKDEPTDGVHTDDPTTTTTTVPTSSTVSTTSTGETGTTHTGDTGTTVTGEVVDCAALSASPLSAQILAGPRAHHGLAFDDLGNLLGTRNNDILAWDSFGGQAVYSPGFGYSEQFDMAPDGNLYVAAGNAIRQVAPSGAYVNVGTGISAYGLKVGPDGMIYAADNNQIFRVDPVAQTQQVYLPSGGGRSPRVMDWSPDGTKFYFAELNGGRVFYMDLDSNYDPIGAPTVLANIGGSYHDGIAVDVCGNLYVAVYSASAMYRITPAGQVSTFTDTPLQNYGHGVQFGSGVGGWRADALYVPQPYNGDTVAEMVIGVYHRTWGGTVVNAP
ncbi:MAG: SMP-30/gluconolactonase/LRE family protein [Myxococcota bacterium]